MKNQSGFTLMELVIAVVIIGIVGSVAYGVFLFNSRVIYGVTDSANMRWEIRKTLDLMRNEIQGLEDDAIGNGAADVFNNHQMHFTTSAGTRISYRIQQNSTLQKKIGSGPWISLISDMDDAYITYYDKNMNQTSTKSAIRQIKINLDITVNGRQSSIEDMFYLRNDNVVRAGGSGEGDGDDGHGEDDDDDHGDDGHGDDHDDDDDDHGDGHGDDDDHDDDDDDEDHDDDRH